MRIEHQVQFLIYFANSSSSFYNSIFFLFFFSTLPMFATRKEKDRNESLLLRWHIVGFLYFGLQLNSRRHLKLNLIAIFNPMTVESVLLNPFFLNKWLNYDFFYFHSISLWYHFKNWLRKTTNCQLKRTRIKFFLKNVNESRIRHCKRETKPFI